MTTTSFDLTTQPWVRVRTRTGDVTELSLTDTLTRAQDLVALAGDLPTQDVAMLRLLLAILRRSHPGARDTGAWGTLWRRGSFDPGPIADYLKSHRHRFDLLEPGAPFYQVASLATAKGAMTGLARLVADVPAGHQYFTTRSGATLDSMPFAETARWLVHAQAYDPSGIKSGAIGDDRVKGGKGYPIGVSWCGWLGTTILEGGTLFETLMLNLPLGGERGDPAADLPVWERTPQTAASEDRPAPYGPVDLLTWQSRRIRIGHDGSRATGVLIANGDALHPRNMFHHEWMTSWRLSEAQMKLLGTSEPVYMPRAHQPDRAVWRGLEGLLAESADSGSVRTSRPGRWLDWLAELRQDGELSRDLPVRMRAVAMHYGAQSSVTDDVTSDRLALTAAVLADRTLRVLAVDGVRDADVAIRSLSGLAAELAEAAGVSGDGSAQARSAARERGYAALDVPYRHWLAGLHSATEREEARPAWQRALIQQMGVLARELIHHAGQAAWVGREVQRGNDRTIYLDAALAELGFHRRLREAFPEAAVTRSDQNGDAA